MSLYEPQEDSFLLEEAVKEFLQENAFDFMKILDMGTGPGIIINSIKEMLEEMRLKAKLYAVDINKGICKIKKEGVNFIISDLFTAIRNKFDLIIFNPPYLPESVEDSYLDKELKKAVIGGAKGYETVIIFLEEVPKYLENNGKCLFLISSLTGKDRIEKKLSEKFEWRIMREQKFMFEKLYVYVASKKQC